MLITLQNVTTRVRDVWRALYPVVCGETFFEVSMINCERNRHLNCILDIVYSSVRSHKLRNMLRGTYQQWLCGSKVSDM